MPVAVAGLEPDGDGSGRSVGPGGLRAGGVVELAVAVEIPGIGEDVTRVGVAGTAAVERDSKRRGAGEGSAGGDSGRRLIGLTAATEEASVGPIRMVVIDIVAAVLDDKAQLARAGEVGTEGNRVVGPRQTRAAGPLGAVRPDLEHDRTVSPRSSSSTPT